jgi:hypothetical protein
MFITSYARGVAFAQRNKIAAIAPARMANPFAKGIPNAEDLVTVAALAADVSVDFAVFEVGAAAAAADNGC